MLHTLKGVMIVLDGLGDRPHPDLGGVTPLEAANTPHMNRLSANGLNGLVHLLTPGIPLETHTAMSILLGLPLDHAMLLERGPVEAAGIGAVGDPGCVYMRGNFATLNKIEDGYQVIDRRAGRIVPNKQRLIEAVQEIDLAHDITARIYPATGHRVVLCLRGEEVSSRITQTDPGTHDYRSKLLKSQPKDPTYPSAAKTAEAVNQLTDILFERMSAIADDSSEQTAIKANGMIFRDAGQTPICHTLNHRLGLKTAVVAGEKTILGLASLFGYTAITRREFTGMPDTDIQGKIDQAKQALEQHDLVYVHIKATDICSHDRNPIEKRDILNKVDRCIEPLMDQNIVISVIGDHSTDSRLGEHTGDPVPCLMYSPYGRSDSVDRYAENTSYSGGLNAINGADFLKLMLNEMNAFNLYQPDDATYLIDS